MGPLGGDLTGCVASPARAEVALGEQVIIHLKFSAGRGVGTEVSATPKEGEGGFPGKIDETGMNATVTVEAIPPGSGDLLRGATTVFFVFVYTTKVNCTITLVAR
jgi:hypothetical protein